MLGQLVVPRVGLAQWWVSFGSGVIQCWFSLLWHDVTRLRVGSVVVQFCHGWICVSLVVGYIWFRCGSV